MAVTGSVQYALLYSGGAYSTEIGMVTGGSWGEDMNPQERLSIGGYGTIVPGAVTPRVSLDLLPTDGNCLVDSIQRASYPTGDLPSVNMQVGDNARGFYSTGWKINTATLEMSVDSALSASYEFMCAGKPTEVNTGTFLHQPALTTAEWYLGSVTMGGPEYQARSMSFDINNNLIPKWSLNAGTAGSLLYPEALVLGMETVEISAEYLSDPGHDLSGDSFPTATLEMTAKTTGSPVVTITVTATGAKVVSWEEPVTMPNDLIAWTVNYRLDPNSGYLSITVP